MGRFFNKLSVIPNMPRFCLLCVAVFMGTVKADTTWMGGTANWTPGLWSNGVPGTTTTTIIANGGVVTLPGGISGTYGTLQLGPSVGQTGSVDLSGGLLTGTMTVAGQNAGGYGSLMISGGTWNSSKEFVIGYGGQGALDLSGGVMNGDGAFGYLAKSLGQGIITGGTWNSTKFFTIGSSGTGTLQIVDGLVNSGTITMGDTKTGVGVLQVQGGTVSGSQGLFVGHLGTGTLSLSGGKIGEAFVVAGAEAGSNGSINMSDGYLTAGDIAIGAKGSGALDLTGGFIGSTSASLGTFSSGKGLVTVSGGTLSLAQVLYVGNSGSGTMSLSGGQVNSGTMWLGNASGSKGTLNITGGKLTVTSGTSPLFVVGFLGTGSMTLSGGEVVTSHAYIYHGKALMTGGSWVNSGEFDVGSSYSPTLELSGGILQAGAVVAGFGKSTILVNGGTSAGANYYIGYGGAGNVTMNSGLLDGDIFDVGYYGTGNLTMNGGKMQGNSYRVGYAGTGNLTINGGEMNNSGIVYIGTSDTTSSSSGKGIMTISSGTVVASGGVDLAYSLSNTSAFAAQSGVLNLNGSVSGTGVLETSAVVKGDGQGKATLNFNGGLLVASGSETGFISGFAPVEVKINTGGAYIDTGGFDIGLQSQMSGAGALHLKGSSYVTLGGANTFTGGVSSDGAIIFLGQANGLGAKTNGLQLTNGAGLDLAGFTVNIGDLNGSADAIMANSSTGSTAMLVLNGSGASNFAGVIVDLNPSASVILNKVGKGSLTLSGGNTFRGGILLASGTLNLANPTALGIGALVIQGVSTIDNTSGAALTLLPDNPQGWYADFTFKGSQALDLGAGFVVLNGNRTLNVASSTLTVRGDISGTSATFGLTKSGTGTLVLTGSNNYGGATTINAGTLQLGDGGTTGSLGMGQILNKGVFISDRGDASELTNLMGGTGRFIKNGAGSLLLSGSNSYSGGTTLNGGVLTLGAPTALGAITAGLTVNSGTLDVAGHSITVGLLSGTGGAFTNGGLSAATLKVNSSKSGAFEGDLADGAGTLGLIKAGTGTLTLNGNSSYSGGTLLSGGGLNLGSTGAIGTGTLTIAGNVSLDNISGAALSLSGISMENWNANFTFKGSNDLNLGSGNVLLSATRTVNVASHTLFVDGSILGATPTVGLIKTGTGTLTLRGTSSYGGSTTVSAGVLDLEGGTLGSGAILNNGTVILNHSSGLTMANTISGVGLLVKRGSGLLTLSGTNTYKGGTWLEAGGISLGNAKALGAATGDLTINGGTLDLNGHSVVVGLLSGSGGSVDNNGDFATLTTNSSKNGIFAGNLGDAAGSLAFTKAGTGVLTLSGSNYYSGGTLLSAGGLNISNANALGTAAITISGAISLDNTSGGTLVLVQNNDQYWNANFTFKGSDALDLGTGAVLLSAGRTVTVMSSTLTVGGRISGSTSTTGLAKSGTGTLLLTGDNTYGGVTTISAGTLQLGNGGTTGLLAAGAIVDAGTLVVNHRDNVVLDNSIRGAGKVVQAGTGMLTLSGTNSYSGGTILNNGTLLLGNAKALGAATGDLTVNDGTLNLNGQSIAVGLLSGSSGLVINNSGTATLKTNSSKSGVFSGVLKDGPGSLIFAKAGAGTLTLSGSNTYSGGTVLSAGGLNLANANAIGTGVLTISGAATLDNLSGSAVTLVTNNAQQWNANFTFKGSNDLDLGSGSVAMKGTRTLTVENHSLTIGGVISGDTASTGLTKSGTGTLVLTNNNTYTGVTTISAGKLQIGAGNTLGSLSSSSIVNNGVLALNGNFTYDKVISGKGGLQVNGPGAVVLSGANTYSGGTVMNAGSIYVTSDKALGTGNLTLNDGVIGTDGIQHQINIGGNLLWKSNARIELNLNSDVSITESMRVGGSLVALDGAPLVFIFNDIRFSSGYSFTIMTVGKGFGRLTASDFTYESDEPSLNGHFVIEGTSLIFTDASPLGATSTGVDGFEFSLGNQGLTETMDVSSLSLSGSNSYAGGTVLTDGALVSGVGSIGTLDLDSLSHMVSPDSITVVPEPSTWALLLLGMVLLARPIGTWLKGCFRLGSLARE
ncbi:hypothetical protein BH09VER1_BH09VER1_50340 [soil metagenome]